MDPFTQKLLERTRLRREQLQQKLQRTPSANEEHIGDRGLKESPVNLQTVSNQADCEEMNPRKAAGICSKPDTPAITGVRQRIGVLSHREKENAQDVDETRGENATSSRHGRFAELAQQINNWEDDLHHVQVRKAETKKKGAEPVKTSQHAENPPKPSRTFQHTYDNGPIVPPSSSSVVNATENVPAAPSQQRASDAGQASAFSFGSAGPTADQAPPINHEGLVRRPLRPNNEQQSVSVADRFAAWEQRTAQGDSDNTCLQRDGPTTSRVRTKSANVALWEGKLNGAKGAGGGGPVFCLPPPCPLPDVTTAELPPRPTTSATQRRRSRSHNGTPVQQQQAPWSATAGSAVKATSGSSVARSDVTPRRPLTAATPPSSAGGRVAATPTPAAAGSSTCRPATASHRKDESEDEWHSAPTSARKNAWEQKIAEQQTIAEEHTRLMYRQNSGSNQQGGPQSVADRKAADDDMEETPVRKLAAERQQSQAKEHDPAAKAKSEREAELRAVNDRFKNGILSYDGTPSGHVTKAASGATTQPTAAPRTTNTAAAQKTGSSPASLAAVKRGFTDALAVDGYDVEKSSNPNGKSMRIAKVSFNEDAKPMVGTRRKSSPINDQPRRRSSCKIPKLGYDSSSDSSDGEEVSSVSTVPSKVVSSPLATVANTSSVKIPSIGYDSTTDGLSSQDVTDDALSSTTASPTSTDSDSYRVDGTINDLLDDALHSDDEQGSVPAFSKTGDSKYVAPRYDSPDGESKTPVVYSIDAYRSMRKKAESKVPSKNICFKPPSGATAMPACEPATPVFSKQDVMARIKELQELAQHEQSVITQTSNALNQCNTNSQFAGSLEQVECNRLLLIACQKRQAYLAEIERLKCLPTGGRLYPASGKGSLTISDIQLPMKKEFVQKSSSDEESSVHYFVLMVRSGPQIIVTQMVSTQDSISRGVLHIPNMIKLNNIMNDFRYELEIYSMHVSHDSLKTPKKDKKKASKSKGASGFQGHPSMASMRATSFTQITSISLTMGSISQTAFTLPRVPFLSPLQGMIYMKLTCVMECNVTASGFLSMFEDVAGFGAWHRRWCLLSNNKLSYWKYPDDEKIKDPIGQIDLKLCVTEIIQLVSRDKCARPNTLELILSRLPSAGRQRERGTDDVYWLSADTKDDRIFWAKKLNEALTNIRQWYAEAAHPVRQQKPRI